MKLERIQKQPEVGDYVFCSRWGDRSPSAPWEIGLLEEILIADNRQCYRTEFKKFPSPIQGIRLFPYCQVITPLQGVLILGFYPSLEGTDWRTWIQKVKDLEDKSVVRFFDWFLSPRKPSEDD